MSDTFKLRGEYSTHPLTGDVSGELVLSSLISESLALSNKAVGHYDLTTDAVQAVDLGGLTAVNVIVLKTRGGKVKARLTSSDGATQAIPVDDFALILSQSVNYTALDLTRVAGVETIVDVFLGQAST